MESARIEIRATSSLSPAQLEVYALFELMGVHMDNKVFQAIWRLVEMNVPTSVIMDILRDAARQ